ncbi:fibrocystin-L-like isoform 1-T3 [Polymixia lowei]
MYNSTENTAEFRDGAAAVTVTRPQRATAPLNGTFAVEIYGSRVEGLTVDVGEDELKYALEGIPGMGQVQVKREGSCRRPQWKVRWLSNPGDQPLMQINDSFVVGNNPVVKAHEQTKGGLFMRSLMGSLSVVQDAGFSPSWVRTSEAKPTTARYSWAGRSVPRCSGQQLMSPVFFLFFHLACTRWTYRLATMATLRQANTVKKRK